MVSIRAPGMSRASSATQSWGTWLCAPPPITRVFAVIRPSRSSHAGSGLSICRRMASTISQSYGSSPSGRCRGAALARTQRRDVLQDQPSHPLRIIPGQQVADEPAHRVPDQVHPVELEGVKEAPHVSFHELNRVVAGPVTAPVTAQVRRIDPALPGEGRGHAVPIGRALAQPVQQDQRRRSRRTPDPVGQPDPGRLDHAVIDHAVIVHAATVAAAFGRTGPCSSPAKPPSGPLPRATRSGGLGRYRVGGERDDRHRVPVERGGELGGGAEQEQALPGPLERAGGGQQVPRERRPACRRRRRSGRR